LIGGQACRLKGIHGVPDGPACKDVVRGLGVLLFCCQKKEEEGWASFFSKEQDAGILEGRGAWLKGERNMPGLKLLGLFVVAFVLIGSKLGIVILGEGDPGFRVVKETST